jgi:hypothetical protein
MLPVELKETARKVLEACKDVRKFFHIFIFFNNKQLVNFPDKQYKDGCDKIYYSTKCMYDFDPSAFVFP